MRFKKWMCLLAVFALTALAAVSSAFAEDEVKVEVISLQPAELTEAGTVSVTFEISNHSDYELSNISIVQGNFVYDIAEDTVIPRFGSAKIPIEVSIADSQIGMPVTFMVSWVCGGEPFFLNKEITVGRAVEPVISVMRTANTTHARQGDKITLTYVLKNETKFDMSEIMLIDEQISDVPIRRNDTLRANDSFAIDYTYTMGNESVVSAPVVTYMVNGKTKSFASIEPVTLAMVNVDLRIEVEMGTPTATGVPFAVTARNIGNQKVTNIYLKDELGNALNTTPFSLDTGDAQTLSYTVVPSMTESVRNVGFSLTGVDPFGDAYSPVFTQTYPVYPYVDDSQISVSMQGSLTSDWSAQTGSVMVRLLIQNNSSVELKAGTLSEASLGTLANYTVLPNGQTVYEGELIIGSPRNLTFSLKATDPAGTERSVATYAMTVAYPETTEEAPVQTPAPQDGTGGGIWSNAITRILIILGAVMLLAFAVLMILTLLERSRTGGGFLMRDEEDEDDLDSDFDLLDEEDAETDYDEEQHDDDALSRDAEYLKRAKLYVPKRRFADTGDFFASGNTEEEDGLAFDDLMDDVDHTRRFDLRNAPRNDRTRRNEGRGHAEDAPVAEDDADDAAYGDDGFATDRFSVQRSPAEWQSGRPAWMQEPQDDRLLPAAESEATADYAPRQRSAENRMPKAIRVEEDDFKPIPGRVPPKVITVRQQARVQPQQRHTIKRVRGGVQERDTNNE